MKYSDYVIKRGASLSEALESLEINEYKALILEDDGFLHGILTDGDIRRFLLKQGSLDDPVETVVTKQPKCVSGYYEKGARDLLDTLDCTVVPMLDDSGRVHALVFSDVTVHRMQEDINNRVIIMAGGLGTRLYPYTEILPKPLIPVGRATITELIIDRFRKFGCRDITLVLSHKKNLVKAYFSEIGTDYSLSFAEETRPLGTGGGLALFKGQFSEPAFVTYCDNVVEADYRDILYRHNKDGSVLTVVVLKKTVNIPYGVMEIGDEGEVSGVREKPDESYLINAGFYVVSPEFIDLVEDNKFQHITDLIEVCRSKGLRVGSYQIEENCFTDIGQLEDLKALGNRLG